MTPDLFDLIAVLGIILVTAGIALIYLPAAFIVAGFALTYIGIYGPTVVRKR